MAIGEDVLGAWTSLFSGFLGDSSWKWNMVESKQNENVQLKNRAVVFYIHGGATPEELKELNSIAESTFPKNKVIFVTSQLLTGGMYDVEENIFA